MSVKDLYINITTNSKKWTDIAVPMVMVISIGLMIVPVAPEIIDFFLSVSIGFTVLVMMGVIYIKDPLEFSGFPAMLLMNTVFRLSLNVSTTRLILGSSTIPPDAGGMINAFSSFVAGGNTVVGFVMFLIFVIINFVVITKGSTRITEVAARFSLDAMPGKQMSIDADLNAGLIDEAQAQSRRARLTQEMDFYGSMDGASKFVRGDAVAGLIITGINLLGGFVIGVAMNGMDWTEAMKVYTMLTIGDGLVSQIPALILSTGAGLLITRSNDGGNMGATMVNQFVTNPGPRAAGITGIVLLLMAATPLPKPPLIILGIGLIGLSWALQKTVIEEIKQKSIKKAKDTAAPTKSSEPENIESLLRVDPMDLEVGYGLIPLVDTSQGGDLLDRITNLRRTMATDLGIVVPPIRIRDNMELEADAYRVHIRGTEVANGRIYADRFMAMDSGMAEKKVDGIETVEPAFGMPAIWVTSEHRDEAQMLGYTVVDPTSVISTHITEIVKLYSAELLTREEVSKLITEVKKNAPAVVEEVIEKDGGVITKGELQQVLKNLLEEKVSIRNMEGILETLGDWASKTKDIEVLTEYVRNTLARDICFKYREDNGKLYVITLDPALEDTIFNMIERTENGSYLKMSSDQVQMINNAIASQVEVIVGEGHIPILLVAATIRAQVKHMTSRPLSSLVVLSYNEMVREVEVESVAMVTLN